MIRAFIAVAALLASTQALGQRIVTLAPHLAELVCAVGACDQLVGVASHSNFPESVAELPRVGDAHSVNSETVLSLRPDLVLAWKSGTPERMIEQLRQLGLRVELVATRSLDDIGLNLLRVGALLGHEDQACEAESRFREQLEALRARYADRQPIRVMYQLEPEPVYTVNATSPISDAIRLCGARNVFADYGVIAGPVSREAVIARNPDAIVFGAQDDVAGIRSGWKRFPALRANRSDNLIAVDADTLARATPRIIEGARELCEALEAARGRVEALDSRR